MPRRWACFRRTKRIERKASNRLLRCFLETEEKRRDRTRKNAIRNRTRMVLIWHQSMWKHGSNHTVRVEQTLHLTLVVLQTRLRYIYLDFHFVNESVMLMDLVLNRVCHLVQPLHSGADLVDHLLLLLHQLLELTGSAHLLPPLCIDFPSPPDLPGPPAPPRWSGPPSMLYSPCGLSSAVSSYCREWNEQSL